MLKGRGIGAVGWHPFYANRSWAMLRGGRCHGISVCGERGSGILICGEGGATECYPEEGRGEGPRDLGLRGGRGHGILVCNC